MHIMERDYGGKLPALSLTMKSSLSLVMVMVMVMVKIGLGAPPKAVMARIHSGSKPIVWFGGGMPIAKWTEAVVTLIQRFCLFLFTHVPWTS